MGNAKGNANGTRDSHPCLLRRNLLTLLAAGVVLILTLSLYTSLLTASPFVKNSDIEDASTALAAESSAPLTSSNFSSININSSLNEFLFVASHPGVVKLYDATTGQYVRDFISVENNGGLTNPSDLYFGPDGNLYVFSDGKQIKRYNGTTGAFIDNFADIATPDRGATEIGNFVFGPDGNIYVAFGRSFSTEGVPVPQFESVIRR
jgi:hypothetical protein